ncbi:ABC-2 type transport system ATP-binding protein [Allocatelliglobosispora scoriae]|uniref:ABC-2 type transport system ATP-binding protein n=1 Tax=Allocatelliglobosispora scoriae TaxID=643052 RepID=A0A841BZW7_9ACTN|nr:ABC transporter ATP-binding protein [Allocatelliglobosispora scoriae]MBB5873674.1 ABC-2 type transport system ATP-binding protein [Allocatelliglobosispora scoriae]
MPQTTDHPVLHAEGLTKRYGRRAALTDCDLHIPQGRVIGLVGPNGAGKSTLLQLATGLIEPTSGTLRVLGSSPAANAAHLARVGFVAQDTPVYASFSVADHLRMGARLNPSWDPALAQRRIRQVGLDPRQQAGRLSGGQRAQLALTIAAAKRPELLIFDEPAAALDPLARDGFLQSLLEFVTELGASALLSSHLLGDVERVCDHLIVLADSRVELAGEVSELLAAHRRVIAPRGDLDRRPAGIDVIAVEHTHTQSRAVVRLDRPHPDLPWTVEPIGLEELVLGYLTRAAAGEGSR